MEQFAQGEIKILICTNIVESGLDIQNANTIIIQDVQLFGLAQLYQVLPSPLSPVNMLFKYFYKIVKSSPFLENSSKKNEIPSIFFNLDCISSTQANNPFFHFASCCFSHLSKINIRYTLKKSRVSYQKKKNWVPPFPPMSS
jgi:hypothetical protein